MIDGVGMTPEDEGTGSDEGTNAGPSGVPRAGQDVRGPGGTTGAAGPGRTTYVTGWTGGADRTAEGGSDAGSGSPEATTDLGATGTHTIYTEDPAMTDPPAEGGIEEAER